MSSYSKILLLGDLIRSNAFLQSEGERERVTRSLALSLSLSCPEQFHSISCAQVLLVFALQLVRPIGNPANVPRPRHRNSTVSSSGARAAVINQNDKLFLINKP